MEAMTTGWRSEFPRIILASASPRRRVLLDSWNTAYTIRSSDVSEELDEPIAEPATLVRRLSSLKAHAVGEQMRITMTDALVIGADTVIVLDSAILGKPRDAADARRTLRLLRNRTHQALTGVTVYDLQSGIVEVEAVSTDVLMRDYSDCEIDDYVATGEPLDKAGSYGIQARGHALVRAIHGCYTNIVGLPLCEVAFLLRQRRPEMVLPEVPCSDPSSNPCPRLLHRAL
jgi:septum formation protein